MISEKDPYDYQRAHYIRAAKQAAWLRRVKAEPAEYATTNDFSMATPFDTPAEAKRAWEVLKAALIKAGGKAPAWLQENRDPMVFEGVSPEGAPGRLKLFMGISQGRFVGEQGAGISRRWCMVTSIDEASVFTTQASAMSALASALPARGIVTASVLPLDCAALPPMAYRDLPADPLAGAMTAAAARLELEGSVPSPESDAPAAKPRSRPGL